MLLQHRKTLSGNSSGADSVSSQRKIMEWSIISYYLEVIISQFLERLNQCKGTVIDKTIYIYIKR